MQWRHHPVALGAVSDAHMVMECSVFFPPEVVQCPISRCLDGETVGDFWIIAT